MRFYSLAVRNLKEIYRDPLTVLLGLGLPIVFYGLFSSLQKQMPYDLYAPQNLTPGIIIFSFSFIIMFSATLLARDKQYAFLIRLFTTPLKPSDYILSYILPFIPIAILQISICFIGGVVFGAHFHNVFLVILLFIVVAFLCICIGVILGSLFTVSQVSGIGSLLITFIGLFSGVWIDLNMIGGMFAKIGYALPFSHAIDISKILLSGADFSGHYNSLIIIIVYTSVAFVLANISFRRTMRKI